MAKKTGVELEFSILDDDFKKAIKEMNSSISSMKKELNLENEVLKSSNVSITDYQNKLNTLKQQQEISKNKIQEATAAYEKAKEMFGENSKEASKYKDTLVTAQTEQQKITNDIEKTTKSLEEHEAALKEDEQKNRELNSTLGTLTLTINEQKNYLEDLKRQYVNTVLEQGKGSDQAKTLKEEIKNLSSEIKSSEDRLNNAESELKEFSDAEDKAGKHAVTFGEMIKANLISDAIKKGISEIANGVKQLGNFLFNTGQQAFESFGDYEQLVGGVDTLFKDSSIQVQEYANNAYKTSGLSANKYMETVTSFSASLLQSLDGDTKKAAEIADMAIVDMSDNANKMGTDMSMIQNAYQGFAKQNYTMLDNLKLGYGGTKTEMERLLADAEKITGIKYDISNLNDVYQAIHVIQGELGITGTTAKEASTTIQGSAASMKSAWKNLLTGMADSNANHKQLVQNFVDSIIGQNGEGGVLGNVLPRIRIMIDGAKQIFSELWKQLPRIAEEVPQLKPLIDILQWIKDNASLITSSIGGITTAIVTFKTVGTVTNIISGFKTLFATIKSGQGVMATLNSVMNANPIGLIVSSIAGLVIAFTTLWNTSEEFRNFWIGLWDGSVNAVSSAIEWIQSFFIEIIDFVTTNCEEFRIFVDNFIQDVISFFQQIPTKVNEFVQNTITFFSELPEKIGFFIGQIIGHILKFGIDAYNLVTTDVPKIVNGIITFFQELPGKIWNFFVDIVNKTTQWSSSMVSKGKETASNFIDNVINFFNQLPGKIWSFLTDIISKTANWGLNLVSTGKEAASNLFNSIVNTLQSLPSEMFNIGKNLVQGIWNGIGNAKDWVINKIKGFGNSIIDGIKSVFGIHSPSTVMENQVGNNLALGVGVGFVNKMKTVAKEMQDSIPTNFDVGVNTNTLTNGYNSNVIVRNITDTSDYEPGQVSPIYITIENFNNNREQDIEDLSEELEFYRSKVSYGRGNA